MRTNRVDHDDSGMNSSTSPVAAGGMSARRSRRVRPAASSHRRPLLAARAQGEPAALATLSGEETERCDLSSLEKEAAEVPGLVIIRGHSGSGASILPLSECSCPLMGDQQPLRRNSRHLNRIHWLPWSKAARETA